MDRDATLDGFSGSEAKKEERERESKSESTAKETPATNGEPARSTYAWSSDGDPCERCKATVFRRWRDTEKLVCEDCKEW